MGMNVQNDSNFLKKCELTLKQYDIDGDGKTTVDELFSKPLFVNEELNARAKKLAYKYAGEGQVFNSKEYALFLNSKEYIEIADEYKKHQKSDKNMEYVKLEAEMKRQTGTYVSSIVSNCESSDIKSIKKEAMSKIKLDYKTGKITKDQYKSAKNFISDNSLLEYLPDHDVLIRYGK